MAELLRVAPQISTSFSGCSIPGKDARRTVLIQVKIVAFAPMPNANVVTTTNVKPGLLSSVRRLYRKSCQGVSMIRLFLLPTSTDSANDLANGCRASVRENLHDGRDNRAYVDCSWVSTHLA